MIHVTLIGMLKAALVAVIAWAARDEYKNSSYDIKYKHNGKDDGLHKSDSGDDN